MTFTEAKAKLQELAAGRYNSIEYGETTYQNGDLRQKCKMYIEGCGHTDECTTWEIALDQMEKAFHKIYDATQAPN